MARNRMKLAGAAALLAAALTVSAAAETPGEVCARTACRDGGFKIAVFFDKDHYTGVEVTRSPYVVDGSILIFPGETLVFELPVADGKIGTPKFLGAYEPDFPMLRDPQGPPAPPSALTKLDSSKLGANSLVLSYGQTGGQGKGEPSMMLTLVQNTPRTVKLDAMMTVIRPHVTGYQQTYTSTCPLMPKLISIENWVQPLGPIVLGNIRFQPDGAPMVCD